MTDLKTQIEALPLEVPNGYLADRKIANAYINGYRDARKEAAALVSAQAEDDATADAISAALIKSHADTCDNSWISITAKVVSAQSAAVAGEQKPVAWRWKPMGTKYGYVLTDEPLLTSDVKDLGLIVEELYTHPAPADVEALRFADHIINGMFEGGDWDGGAVQELAIKYGLLVPQEMTGPCVEDGACQCAINCGEWPVTCYRKTYRAALAALGKGV